MKKNTSHIKTQHFCAEKIVPLYTLQEDAEQTRVGQYDETLFIPFEGDTRRVFVVTKTSFEARLITASDAVKTYYSELKNVFLSYDGIRAVKTWNHESYYFGSEEIARINILDGHLVVYYALDPEIYNRERFGFTDVSNIPGFADLPMKVTVVDNASAEQAKELSTILMDLYRVDFCEVPTVDYWVPFEKQDALFARDLLKVVLLEKKKMPDGTEALVDAYDDFCQLI